jgi:dTDP-4-dehydrorhamnose reductase
MKILILGASGLVGNALIEELSMNYDVYGTYNRTKLKITDDKQVQWDISEIKKITEFIEKNEPNIIISCLRGDFNVQFEAHVKIIEKIKLTSTRFIFCSTTNVFDGDVARHHSENDLPIAESDYGQFKINCENLIKDELNERGIIVRLPMVWGKNSPRLNDLKDKIKNRQNIEAYGNIYLNHALDKKIAKQTRQIIESNLNGTFHLSTADIESQYSFISKLVQQLSNEGIVKKLDLQDIDQYNFGLLISRTDLPEQFNYINDDLINEII